MTGRATPYHLRLACFLLGHRWSRVGWPMGGKTYIGPAVCERCGEQRP